MTRELVVLDYGALAAAAAAPASASAARVLDEVGLAYSSREDGLGVLAVSGVPGFSSARRRLLPLARELAGLGADALQELERPEADFQFGWSHGREKLERTGLPDTAKGSFYANPFHSAPGGVPASAGPNVWPSQRLPALEPCFKELSAAMAETAALVARLCDAYLARQRGLRGEAQTAADAPPPSLEATVRTSASAKGRLLYYFPRDASVAAPDPPVAAPAPSVAWCGKHCDHGSLTCLTKALYFDEASGRDVTAAVEDALTIEAGSAEDVRVRIPDDCVAIQMGQAAQIQSGGLLRATPHHVGAPCGPGTGALSRCTFALFLQPDDHTPLLCPKATPGSSAEGHTSQPLRLPLPAQYMRGMSFGDFAAATVRMHYDEAPSDDSHKPAAKL